jgi:geranylgeranyl pyrophosphate synthase
VSDVLDELLPWRERIESKLKGLVAGHVDVDGTRPPARLSAAMAHALLSGGKRLRPLLCLSMCDVVGGAVDDALPAASALELVHTYSLVHDDLPSLDDDELRRGRPTVHKAFDEATAVLCGDGLLTDAFAVLATSRRHPARQVEELARAAGSAGMVGGQMDDLRNEGMSSSSSTAEQALREVHRRKTGRLFGAAAALGALAADREDLVDDARRYGHLLGFAFQVQDDVLDVEGDVEKGGKVRGRDVKHDKLTYVRARGLDGAKALAREAGEEAAAAAVAIGARAARDPALLLRLARFAAQRTH